MILTGKYLMPLLALSFFYFNCNKLSTKCLKGKVLRTSCASFVVQLLNKDSVGAYGWRDISGHAVYNNVINVSNSCEIGKWQKGEEFYFELVDSLKNSNCMQCRMYDAPPAKNYTIKNVSGIRCR